MYPQILEGVSSGKRDGAGSRGKFINRQFSAQHKDDL